MVAAYLWIGVLIEVGQFLFCEARGSDDARHILGISQLAYALLSAAVNVILWPLTATIFIIYLVSRETYEAIAWWDHD